MGGSEPGMSGEGPVGVPIVEGGIPPPSVFESIPWWRLRYRLKIEFVCVWSEIL